VGLAATALAYLGCTVIAQPTTRQEWTSGLSGGLVPHPCPRLRGLMAKLERVATRMRFEQQTDDLVAKFVLMVPTRWTGLCLRDLGRVQGPSDPPLDLVTLLTQGPVRALVTELEVAVMLASNLMGRIRPTIEPMDLCVAEFNSRRASLPVC
jgi:hypothetical protein